MPDSYRVYFVSGVKKEYMADSHRPYPRSLLRADRECCPYGYGLAPLCQSFALWSGILPACAWLPPNSPSQT